MQAFCNGVSFGAKQLIYVATGEATNAKTPQQLQDLIEKILSLFLFQVASLKPLPK